MSTVAEQMAVTSVLFDLAGKANIHPRDAKKLLDALVSLPDQGLELLAAVKKAQLVQEERMKVRELSAVRRGL